MELNIQNGGNITVSETVFGTAFNEALVHQAVVGYLAGARAGTKAQKTRSDVRGGGIKPWRQKGTGRARAGTIRSPLWRSGGATFAARPQDHSQKINKKMYRSALRSIMSELVRQERLIIVENFDVDSPKTREVAAKLKDMNLDNVLIVTDTVSDNLYLSVRNLFKVGVCEVAGLDPVSLVGAEKILMTVAAVKQVEEKLA